MSNIRTLRICTAATLAGVALLAGTPGNLTSAQTGSAPIVLEDFSTAPGKNGDFPPSDLYQPYLGAPDGNSKQTYDYANQMFNLKCGMGGTCYWNFLPYPYNVPSGYAKAHLRSGTWDAGVNRLTFQAMCDTAFSWDSTGWATVHVGTYILATPQEPAYQGAHYYHYFDPNIYAGKWTTFVVNAHPQHQVGTPGNPGVSPGGVAYFDKLTRFYWEMGQQTLPSGTVKCSFDNFVFSKVTGEPDVDVSSVTAVYAGDHYEVSWATMPNVATTYTVRYAPTSMHAGAAGTALGSTKATGNDYNGVMVKGPAMAEQAGGMYFAIQPSGQSNFTEIFLPKGNPGPLTSALSPPSNLRILP